jgi:hypothetical protein
MILWSKGLGRLVLNMRLSERSGMGEQGERIVIDGTMGAPTFWDYAVNLNSHDVVDFISLLRNPVPVRFLVSTPKRWSILAAAVGGIVSFVGWTLLRFLGAGPPGAAAPASVNDGSEAGQASGGKHGGA